MTIKEFIEKWMRDGVIYDEYPVQFTKDINKLIKSYGGDPKKEKT